MKHTITDEGTFSFANVLDSHSKTLIAYLSTDIHGEQTIRGRATEILYTDALISGAGTYSREAFLDAVNSLGASIMVSISDGVFTIHLKSSAAATTKLLSLVSIMLRAPHFSPQELKRIKQTTINTLIESKENTRALAHEQLRNTLYGIQDRRYTFDEDELIKVIAKITKKDLQALHARILSQAWICSAAGTAPTLDTLKKAIKKLSPLKNQIKDTVSIHQQKPPQPVVVLKNVPSKQNIDFSIGAPVPITLHHPDLLPLMFGLAVLGKWGGFTGRLMSTVREKEGLTYGIYARTETFLNEEQGYWRIMTFFAPEKAVQGLTSTFREIKKLYKDGISDEELVLFKGILSTAQTLQNDSVASMLSDLHAYHMQKFSLQEIAEHKKRIHAITKEEVNAAIRRYLDPKTLTVSAAGPVLGIKKELQIFHTSVS